MTEAFTFSIRLNNNHRIEEYVALAQRAESFGFDQFWVSNDLFLKSAPVILSAVARATDRIGIGTGILNPFTMNPAEIAMIAATLDELSERALSPRLRGGSAGVHQVGRSRVPDSARGGARVGRRHPPAPPG